MPVSCKMSSVAQGQISLNDESPILEEEEKLSDPKIEAKSEIADAPLQVHLSPKDQLLPQICKSETASKKQTERN